MTTDDPRDPADVPAVPQPRTDGSDVGPAPFGRRTRPSTQYWDVETAGWRPRGPAPGPRRGN
jgi:hypothetical protein